MIATNISIPVNDIKLFNEFEINNLGVFKRYVIVYISTSKLKMFLITTFTWTIKSLYFISLFFYDRL